MNAQRGYSDGAARGVLVLQKCGSCGLVRHYPQVLCPSCYSFDVEPLESIGTGTVHSWTVAHHAFDPAFADQLPYVLLTVDMAEGVRVLGRFSGEPAMGAAVRITFEPAPDGSPMPMFVAV